jgi:hypothetical protein
MVYESPDPTRATGYYSDMKDAFIDAIGYAERAGFAGHAAPRASAADAAAGHRAGRRAARAGAGGARDAQRAGA